MIFTFITLDGKLFFQNYAGIKDRAEEYAKLFVDTNALSLSLLALESQMPFKAP